jgi:hypothetical protein
MRSVVVVLSLGLLVAALPRTGPLAGAGAVPTFSDLAAACCGALIHCPGIPAPGEPVGRLDLVEKLESDGDEDESAEPLFAGVASLYRPQPKAMVLRSVPVSPWLQHSVARRPLPVSPIRC